LPLVPPRPWPPGRVPARPQGERARRWRGPAQLGAGAGAAAPGRRTGCGASRAGGWAMSARASPWARPRCDCCGGGFRLLGKGWPGSGGSVLARAEPFGGADPPERGNSCVRPLRAALAKEHAHWLGCAKDLVALRRDDVHRRRLSLRVVGRAVLAHEAHGRKEAGATATARRLHHVAGVSVPPLADPIEKVWPGAEGAVLHSTLSSLSNRAASKRSVPQGAFTPVVPPRGESSREGVRTGLLCRRDGRVQ
jgi:hypothetical protein